MCIFYPQTSGFCWCSVQRTPENQLQRTTAKGGAVFSSKQMHICRGTEGAGFLSSHFHCPVHLPIIPIMKLLCLLTFWEKEHRRLVIWKLQLRSRHEIWYTGRWSLRRQSYTFWSFHFAAKKCKCALYNIDTSKLKSQAGPKSGWQLPFRQFYGSLRTPQEADYINYILLIVESF